MNDTQDLQLHGEALRLFKELTPELQRKYIKLRENTLRAKEYANSFIEMMVAENVPMEVMEITANLIYSDYKEIKASVEDMLQEAEVLRYERSEKERNS